MNRFLTVLALVLTGLTAGSVCAQSTRKAAEAQRKAARDAERAKIKAEDQAEQMIAYQEAIKALQAGQFVLEANQAVLQNGVTNYVNSDTNFVMVDGSNGTVQTSSNSGFAGPNGIGGVTLNGTVSDISLKTDRHSNVYYSFSIQGAAISAQVFITLSAGTSNASATISPNFTSNTLTFNGSLVPLQQSDIFMGNSF